MLTTIIWFSTCKKILTTVLSSMEIEQTGVFLFYRHVVQIKKKKRKVKIRTFVFHAAGEPYLSFIICPRESHPIKSKLQLSA